MFDKSVALGARAWSRPARRSPRPGQAQASLDAVPRASRRRIAVMTSEDRHEHPRIPGQGGAEGIRRAGLARRRRSSRRTRPKARRRARRPALGGEVADPCRRPRQGQVQGSSAGEKGGVRLAKSIDEVKDFAEPDARHDAGDRSRPARPASRSTASISRTAPTSRSEFYLSLLVDRATSRIAFVVSTEGGMDIEEVAHDDAREDRHLLRRSGDRHHAASRPHASPRRSASPAISPSRPATLARQALHGLRRQGHEHAGDQPADRHQGRAS